jgi:hypothetical protein
VATPENPPADEALDDRVDPQALFPAEGTWEHVQTAWTRTGADYELGFEEAARLLVELASEKQRAAGDHVGLAVVFLERHRLELMLKNGIGYLSRKATQGHRLMALWDEFERLATQSGYIDAAQFEDSRALVTALDRVDPIGQAFRYPADNKGRPHTTPEFIDLPVLHAAVNQVWRDVAGTLGYLEQLEDSAPDWEADARWWRDELSDREAEREGPA